MNSIILRGIKTHNLKDIDLNLEHRKFYVITGVSGSGKSSLAFDTLYAEGQRRYIESVSSYARQFLERMPKPDVRSVYGIPPALAIQSKNVISNARSTVGTQTEINDYLRIVFAKTGKIKCSVCNSYVEKYDSRKVLKFISEKHKNEYAQIFFSIFLSGRSKKYLKENVKELEKQGFEKFFLKGKALLSDELVKKKNAVDEFSVVVDELKIVEKNKNRLIDSLESAFRFGKGSIAIKIQKKVFKFSETLKCPSCAVTFEEPAPNLFSFNSPLGACPSCQGFGREITIDWDLVIPDPEKSITEGAVSPLTKDSTRWEAGELIDFCKRKKVPVKIPWKRLTKKQKKWILEGCKEHGYSGVKGFFDYLKKKTYKMHVRIFLNRYRGYTICSACNGKRLKQNALSVYVEGKNIAELQTMSIEKHLEFWKKLERDSGRKEGIGTLYQEILKRLAFLKNVGLGYLSLNRMSRTLSGGEVERIHLASSLGSALVDTLYVLDEPSIGLHERDNQMLINLLRELRDLGNTVVVVEHDKTMIKSADEVIDLGPSGGSEGGHLVYQGSVDGLKKCKGSITGEYLSGKKSIERKVNSHKGKETLQITGAKTHNLKNINVKIPFGSLVALTGVSGSGKSTLLYNIIYNHYRKFKGLPVSKEDLGEITKIKGFEHLENVILIDQSPLGRSPRSNPATYMKIFDCFRKLLAGTREAKREGLTAGNFSFNVDGGRCPVCRGDGSQKIEMHFLADVYVVCEACNGKRFKENVLEITYRGKNVDDILKTTVDEAFDFFSDQKNITEKLSILKKAGLGYLLLGQSTLTLSGGEAQRLKLAFELSQKVSGKTLYLFDEPTTGLHEDDIKYLIKSFDELIARGHSLLVIEHHIEIIRISDYVIDLGPEGGDMGGEVVYEGNVKGLLNSKSSYTGKCLKKQAKL